ncbi:MAG: GH25 family lysozyme [Prevotella sp.]|nr:glycosyl hydrolase family 25 [Prevotella sp.]MDY4218418.1 GH25 family lysozyme [Prevotella sp.]
MVRRHFFLIVVFMLHAVCAKAQYTIQCEDTCAHIHGLDMNYYQDDQWWKTVGENSHHKISFVYLKTTEGKNTVDKKYLENLLAAQRNGIKVGSYHFYRPMVPQKEQLKSFRTQCRPQEQDLIPMIDIETTGGLTPTALKDSLTKFLDLVTAEYGIRPLIYTYASFYNRYLSGGTLNGYKLIIAQYTQKPPELNDGRDIYAWQYTGKGKINGLKDYVDKIRLMERHSIREIKFQRITKKSKATI